MSSTFIIHIRADIPRMSHLIFPPERTSISKRSGAGRQERRKCGQDKTKNSGSGTNSEDSDCIMLEPARLVTSGDVLINFY